MTGASARWSRLHVPVETGTPPYIVGAKSAPLRFRLSAKTPLRFLAPPLPRKAAARPFLGSRGFYSQSPLCSASACRRKRRCASLLLLFLEKPLHGLFSEHVGFIRKVRPALLPPIGEGAAALPCSSSSSKSRCTVFSRITWVLFAKSALLCFRLSAKAEEKAAARPFLSLPEPLCKVRPFCPRLSAKAQEGRCAAIPQSA